MMSDKIIHAASTLPTRRQAITRLGVSFGGFALGLTELRAATREEIFHTAEAIHQELVINASKKRIYEALIDDKQFHEVTKISAAKDSRIPIDKVPTEISREVGGAFKLFGGIIVGRHIELVPNTRLVQAWREVYWDPGVYSIVKFDLVDQGSATKISFDHTGFPTGAADHLAAGWKSHYWEPLAQFLA
jgi:activator of HSP90 ATPase